ncbi:MAG: methyl-accepting chemotaxis protein [Azoarcus sp.]|jgi:methyl-accepting chemotaxis protein|nr:methyl-accepting chemotaxis protein [Azoarcus sp.]
MKIKTKLLLLIALSVCALASVAGVGLYSGKTSENSLAHFTEILLPVTQHVQLIHEDETRIRALLLEAILYETDYSDVSRRVFADVHRRYKEALANTGEAREVYSTLVGHASPVFQDGIKPLRARFAKAHEEWKQAVVPVDGLLDKLASLSAGDVDGQKVLMAQLIRVFHAQEASFAEQEASIADQVKFISMRAESNKKDAIELSSFLTWVQIVVSLSAVCVIGFLFWSAFRAIMKPLELTRDTMQQITTDNDLTRRVDVNSNDEIGEVVKCFNALASRLHDALSNINAAARGVVDTASAVSATASQVAESSANQSSATSAMAAAVEEMTVSISTVSSNAEETRTLAHEAGQTSEHGSELILRTAEEMNQIANTVGTASSVILDLGEASKQITSVVNVIKEVADQTNLLALNAAIEAARAGEQGRGFAVVADEVRKLAERTAQSTVDISSMVDKIQTSAKGAVETMQQVVAQVDAGKTLAQEAGECISSIQSGANRVSLAVTEISSALREQSRASQDIAKHVESVAQMSDENHAAADETLSSARHAEELAQGAGKAAAMFRL